MATYDVQFVASAAKEFRSLPLEIKRRVRQAVDALQQNPRPAGVRRLHGHERLYRIRVGHYRIVYEIDDEAKSVVVTRMRRRRDVYR